MRAGRLPRSRRPEGRRGGVAAAARGGGVRDVRGVQGSQAHRTARPDDSHARVGFRQSGGPPRSGGPDERFDRGSGQVRHRSGLHRGPRQPAADRAVGPRSDRRAERVLARHPARSHDRAAAGRCADRRTPDAVVFPDRLARFQALAQVPRGILLPHRLHARGGDPRPMARVRPDGPGAHHRAVRGGGGQSTRARPHARRHEPGGARGDCRTRRRPRPLRRHVHGRRRAGDRRQTAPGRSASAPASCPTTACRMRVCRARDARRGSA